MTADAEALVAAQEPLPAHRRSAAQAIAAAGGDLRTGLRAAEATARLARHGRNELPSEPPVAAWRRFLAQFENVLTLLLLAAIAISLVAWWIEGTSPVPYEALTILAIVLLNAALGFVQEGRAEQALRALAAMAAPSARVLRDGAPRQVPTSDVVPGDVLLLEEGDDVAADARVVEAVALRVAEAALTGESAPVAKTTAALAGDVPLGDRTNMVHRGTAVAAGRGRAVVTATGPATELGRIAGALRSAPDTTTPLQRELDRVGRLLGGAVVVVALAIGATLLALEELRTVSELVGVLLLAVSLAVAAVPEGLTAITTVVLSLGTQRMARRNVIVRTLSSVETLGSTTVICSDKTGTLTRNEMTVRAIVTASGAVELTGAGYDPAGEVRPLGAPDAALAPALREEVTRALAAAERANNAALVREDGRWGIRGDPTEGALLVAARKVGHAAEALARRFPRIGEVPFSSERKLMSTVHEDAEDPSRLVVFAKGAPDLLLARCAAEQLGSGTRPLGAARRRELAREIDRLAASALRTLGVAWRPLARGALAGAPTEQLERELVFLGVVGMIDPPRPEARAAVAEARTAGVRPVLITGDHPVTASAIAAELGIAAPGARVVTGAELEAMDDEALRSAARAAAVFARVAPEHKLRIVRALTAEGEIAAMTGDGVNDAPALKAAHIGVAMGITGTDVAKGASDMILADDDFASIVAAVEEGRSIFDNVQRFLRFLLSSNTGEVLTMFLGVVLAGVIGLVPDEGTALVVPLLATQILWINLLTDAAPALALGVEPADHDVMLRPPRDPRAAVIGRRAWRGILLLGAVMAASTLAVLDWALPGGLVTGPGAEQGLGRARTMAFTTLVLAQLANVFNARFADRSASHRLLANRWLWGAVASSAALQVAVVHLPFLQRSFGTVPLGPADWLTCLAAASATLWVEELRKWAARRRAATAPRRGGAAPPVVSRGP
jgi:Ca2+-transporting ATPase